MAVYNFLFSFSYAIAVGGFADSIVGDMVPIVEKYDILAGTWSSYKGPPTPHGIGVAGAVVLDNRWLEVILRDISVKSHCDSIDSVEFFLENWTVHVEKLDIFSSEENKYLFKIPPPPQKQKKGRSKKIEV